jgi:hypothetical protein
MEIKTIFLILITFVITIIGFSIIATLSGISTNFPDYLRSFVEGVYSSIFGRPYNICEAYKDKLVSDGEFKTILIALKKNACKDEHAIVRLSFSLSKDDLKKLPEEIKISKRDLVFFREAKPFGVGGIIIEGNPGEYPLKMFDTVEIWAEGSPDKDILIKVIAKGCDPFDDVCDLACSYKRGVCDKECYKHGRKEDVVCDIDCVDVNGNGKIDKEDFDDICDLDCYNNITNPERAYDPDCAKIKVFNPSLASSYGISGFCDPDSNGVRDGICDPDCAKRNFICDPDCDGNVTEGNPNGYLDEDCYVCDKTCNRFCSQACKASDKDPDCPYGFKGWEELEECCGNGVCGKNESCESCKEDCPAGNTCEDFGKICCPISNDADEYGCTSKKNLSQGEECYCDSQCNASMLCTSNHCCPANSFWNGTECSNRTDVLIVALKTNMKKVYSDSQIKQLEEKVKEFIETLNKYDKLGALFLYLDEDKTSDIIGSKVTQPNDWNNIDGILNQLIQKLKAKYLIILGGYDRFVQSPYGTEFPIDDPRISRKPSGSDAPYGDITGDYLLDIPVGRIPDPNNGDLDVILRTLDTSIKLHKNGGISLKSYIAPIMGCGGHDSRPWNSGKCFCSYVFGSSCQACGSCCGCIEPSKTSGKDFVVVLAHGPGQEKCDILIGGCFVSGTGNCLGRRSFGPNDMFSLDVSDSMWMSMACGGGHLKLKSSTSDSITMSFLKNGGAVFIGSTNLNFGDLGGCGSIPGGDGCIGTLYALIAKKFAIDKRLGDIYKEGKNEYYSKYSCEYGGNTYHYYINCFYGDPTLKIKEIGW